MFSALPPLSFEAATDDSVRLEDREFVKYAKEHLDVRRRSKEQFPHTLAYTFLIL